MGFAVEVHDHQEQVRQRTSSKPPNSWQQGRRQCSAQCSKHTKEKASFHVRKTSY